MAIASASPGAGPRAGRLIHIGLWVVQALLAALFALTGYMKVTLPPAEFAQLQTLPLALVRFIGIAELAGALGLILPAATRILAWLTPLAAVGLLTVMVLATGFHIVRGEWQFALFTLALGLLAAFVAWGRYRRVPIAPRG